MGLGICLSKCCAKPCNLCTGNKVPQSLTLTMSGWTDAYISNSVPCPGDTGTTLVSTLSALNTTIQLDLITEVSNSSPDNCCAVYYGEMSYPTFVAHCGGSMYQQCVSNVFSFKSAAYSNTNTVGIYATVFYNGPGSLYIAITSAMEPPEDTIFTICAPSPVGGGGGWETGTDWFCNCDGDTGNLISIDPTFDRDFVTYSNGGYLLTAVKACYTLIGASAPTSVVLSASCTKVSL